MNVEFDKSFNKALKKLKDKSIFPKIEEIIEDCEKAVSIQKIPKIKKLKGFSNFYRIRLNDYRIGIELVEDTITFITIAHRKEIYKKFP